MATRRNQPLWDSVKFKGAAANGNVEFFQTPVGGTGTTSEASPVSYKKTDYATNNKLAGVTEQGQILKITGIGVRADDVDADTLKKIVIDTQAVVEVIVKEQTVFKLPLFALISNSTALAGMTGASSYVKQIWSKNDDYFKFPDIGIMVDGQTTFKVKITFYKALTDLSAYVNLFVFLYGVEERA